MNACNKIRAICWEIRHSLYMLTTKIDHNKKIDRQIYALGQFQMKKKI